MKTNSKNPKDMNNLEIMFETLAVKFPQLKTCQDVANYIDALNLPEPKQSTAQMTNLELLGYLFEIEFPNMTCADLEQMLIDEMRNNSSPKKKVFNAVATGDNVWDHDKINENPEAKIAYDQYIQHRIKEMNP